MLNKILELALGNRLIVLLAAAAFSAFGVYIVNSMEVDVFPDLTAPTVTVLTESHGMEAEEVERCEGSSLIVDSEISDMIG